MKSEIEELYGKIGREACSLAPDLQGRLLVYAEVEAGVVSGSIFYERGPSRVVTFKFCSQRLQDLIYSLWERWNACPGNEEWRAVEYSIEDEKFRIDFAYPEQMRLDEGLPERRPRVIEKYFGDSGVDYSQR